MESEKLLSQIIRRLDILISLQLESIGDIQSSKISTKINRLSDLGLTASEIAKIINKPVNYITAVLSRGKSPKKNKGGKND